MDDPFNDSDPLGGNDDRDRFDGTGTGSGSGNRIDLDTQFKQCVESLVSEEPRTVREVHQELGESAGLSRDQTEYRLGKLSSSGTISAKKSPGRTGPKIFWKDNRE